MVSPDFPDGDTIIRGARLERMARAAILAISDNPDAWDNASERARGIFRRIAFAVHMADVLDDGGDHG